MTVTEMEEIGSTEWLSQGERMLRFKRAALEAGFTQIGGPIEWGYAGQWDCLRGDGRLSGEWPDGCVAKCPCTGTLFLRSPIAGLSVVTVIQAIWLLARRRLDFAPPKWTGWTSIDVWKVMRMSVGEIRSIVAAGILAGWIEEDGWEK